ncbi:MAG: copper resistance protein CopC [Actinobacteria bacterium]|nr:copper resistance protein CopC [Actinomycetota bacterium]
MSRSRRALAVALTFAAATLLVAPAGAHALVKSSEPARGALLDAAPTKVTITFTERPDTALSTIRVLDTTGGEVQNGTAKGAPGNADQLTVPLKQLDKGVYTVAWRTVSRVDGHVTAGSFAFGVGVSPAGAVAPKEAGREVTPKPSPAGVTGKWLLYWGLALLLGAAATALLVFRRGSSDVTFLGMSWLAALVGIVIMTIAESRSIGISISKLLSSSTGAAYVQQLIAVLIAGAATVLSVVKRNRTSAVILSAAASAALLMHVKAGHAGGASAAPLKISIQFVHVIAVGVWIGGLAWLIAGARRLEDDDRIHVVARFSRLAGIAVAAVAATGILRAIDELGGWRPLFHTGFGQSVLIKSALLGVLALLGAFNRWKTMPSMAKDPKGYRTLRRSVIAEIVIAAVVLGVTGVMTSLPPPNLVAAQTKQQSSGITVGGADFATTVRVRMTITPGIAGSNQFNVRVTDYDTKQPVDARRVALRVAMPSRPDIGAQTIELMRSGNAWTVSSTALAIDGRWNITVVVETAEGGVEVELSVRTKLPPQDIQISKQKGQPTLYTITLPQGGSVQAYVDPGEKAGKNDVHFTFFDSQGNEFPVDSAVMQGTPPGGDPQQLTVRRFGPGHFVATATLTAGTWLFQVQAKAGGFTYSAYFSQDIPA